MIQHSFPTRRSSDLGYPHHPPSQPEKLRAAHLGQIRVPILCLQGTRDAFGAADELRPHFPAVAHIVSVAGGHSFAIDDTVLDRIARFVCDPDRDQ